MHRRTVLKAGLLGASAFLANPARALTNNGFPTHNVRLIVPAAPGGSADTLARTLGHQLDLLWPHKILIENLSGGGGRIGASQVAKSVADGYTILHGTDSLALNAASPDGLPFDPLRDFTGVTKAITSPMLWLVRPGLGVDSFKDFIELARANPGKISVGLPAGSGSLQHLAVGLLASLSNITLNTIPYRGGGPAMLDTVGGHIDSLIITLPAATENVRSGRLIGLAVTTANRSKALPDVPTAQELGIDNYLVSAWQGFFVRRGTPEPIIRQLNQDISSILKRPDVAAPLAHQGFEIETSTPAELDQFLIDQGTLYRRVALEAGITLS